MIGSSAVYCWKITNTGNSHLKGISLRNDVLGFELKDMLTSVLAPGDSFTYTTSRIVTRREQNSVHIIAEPSTAGGEDLPYQDVSDSDPSEVGPIAMNPSITIQNTVRNPLNRDWRLFTFNWSGIRRIRFWRAMRERY